jgi:hypothetical protein
MGSLRLDADRGGAEPARRRSPASSHCRQRTATKLTAAMAQSTSFAGSEPNNRELLETRTHPYNGGDSPHGKSIHRP